MSAIIGIVGVLNEHSAVLRKKGTLLITLPDAKAPEAWYRTPVLQVSGEGRKHIAGLDILWGSHASLQAALARQQGPVLAICLDGVDKPLLTTAVLQVVQLTPTTMLLASRIGDTLTVEPMPASLAAVGSTRVLRVAKPAVPEIKYGRALPVRMPDGSVIEPDGTVTPPPAPTPAPKKAVKAPKIPAPGPVEPEAGPVSEFTPSE